MPVAEVIQINFMVALICIHCFHTVETTSAYIDPSGRISSASHVVVIAHSNSEYCKQLCDGIVVIDHLANVANHPSNYLEAVLLAEVHIAINDMADEFHKTIDATAIVGSSSNTFNRNANMAFVKNATRVVDQKEHMKLQRSFSLT